MESRFCLFDRCSRRWWSACCILLVLAPTVVTPTQAEPIACVPGTIPHGDADGRGDVALTDFRRLAECLNGPDLSPPVAVPGCLVTMDFDGDGDVDLADTAAFQRAFTGDCVGLADCPAGMHLVHESGQLGRIEGDVLDELPHNPAEYTCVSDETCAGVDCGPNGLCRVINGVAACGCDQGYAGEDCSQCAVGYQPDRVDPSVCVLGNECRNRLCSGQGNCVDTGVEILCDCDDGASGLFCEEGLGQNDPMTLRPPTRVFVGGTDTSLERGEQRLLVATLGGGGLIDDELNWTLEGPGRLEPRTGQLVTYFAPEDEAGDEELLLMPKITVCSGGFPDYCATRYLTITKPGGIKITGQSHALFKPVDTMMISFMKLRCVGGAVLGISLFGKPVHLRGYGNLSGAPTSNAEYCEECGDTFDVSDHVDGIPLPPPKQVQPNSPFRIGSNTKAIAAAVMRKAVKDIAFGNPATTDDAVETALLCDAGLDLVPASVRAVMCGATPPPTPMIDDDNFDDDPVACADLTQSADSRWQQVTIGHLLGHRSGLKRSVPDVMSLTLPNLAVIRGYTSQSDWNADETALESEFDFPSGPFTFEFPGYGYADSRYFVQRPGIWESVLARLGICLSFNPGDAPPATDNNGNAYDSYSNTAFSIVGGIAEWVSGEAFSGRTGKPGLHSGSLLESFLADDLDFPVPTQLTDEGIFYSQDILRLRDPNEPIYRVWSSSAQTYYPTTRDLKRPYCEWDAEEEICDFTAYTTLDTNRLDWDFADELTLIPWSGGTGDGPPSAGAFSVEAEAMLRFMARYYTGGSGSNPLYGETRCPDGKCVWTIGSGHNGARDGCWSEVRQLAGPPRSGDDCDASGGCGTYIACADTPQAHEKQMFCRGGDCRTYNEYKIPPIDGCTGLPSEDFANLECRTCIAPVGVDVFVALNQRDDKKCKDAQALGENHPDYYSCADAYRTLTSFIFHGLCQIQFPPNPYVLWPTVFKDGGSGMNPGVQFSGGRSTDGPGLPPGDDLRGANPACCGNGQRDPGEECDGDLFGGMSCGSFGFEMGNLSCNNCFIDTQFCSGGVSTLPPASYAACGYAIDPEDEGLHCDGPAGCPQAWGDCVGGPCARTNPNDFDVALFDPFNQVGRFHPDGNFRDQYGNLYYCDDGAGHGEMTCVDQNGWGVCKQVSGGGGALTTKIGAQCDSDDDCLDAEPGLTCWGDEFPGATGFCWDQQDGPPDWQCVEGTCGMSPGYDDDEMYCEHYSLSGVASCQPWYACNAILARVCAGQNVVCEENADPACTDDDCCGAICQTNADCSPAYGWPAGYTCANTPQGARCVP